MVLNASLSRTWTVLPVKWRLSCIFNISLWDRRVEYLCSIDSQHLYGSYFVYFFYKKEKGQSRNDLWDFPWCRSRPFAEVTNILFIHQQKTRVKDNKQGNNEKGKTFLLHQACSAWTSLDLTTASIYLSYLWQQFL